MRILILEYLTGGGLLSQQAAPSLLAEGAVMVHALIRDLLAIPASRLSVFRDFRAARSAILDDPRIEPVQVSSESQFRRCWLERLGQCDAAWVVAPETDGVLERLCREVEASGAALLTSPSVAVQVAADKMATFERLAAKGVPTVATQRTSAIPGHDLFPAVVKPIDGAGCAGSRILRSLDDWRNWARQEDPHRAVLQPLLAGEALSLSVLFNGGRSRLLSCNRQQVRQIDDRFVLDACEVNVLPEMRPEFERLAGRIAEAIPELWGYGGVDLMYTAQGPEVLEVNPRLTTSYSGLHQALGVNPAQWVWDLWRHGKLPDAVPVGARSVRVDAGGRHEH